DMLESVQADRVLTMTLHCPQSQGFSNIPVDQLHADEVFLDKIVSFGTDKLAFVAPDSGSIMNNDFLAMHVARSLREAGRDPDIETGYVKKVRVDDSETPHLKTVEGIDDLSGRTVIINDDETLSGKSLVMCAEIAMERGAKEVYAFVTHGILSRNAVMRIENSPMTNLYVTDTVEFDTEAAEKVIGGPVTKIETLSVARIFAEAIKRTHEGKSLSSLFLGK
ncbi:MAG: ribose-phosphate diphosphokinase, partial [Candidatus Aegiribacteria sp.]|nr:ribose-phosphate diphosphokinase [Candidatus Aegiribacteria sp.]